MTVTAVFAEGVRLQYLRELEPEEILDLEKVRRVDLQSHCLGVDPEYRVYLDALHCSPEGQERITCYVVTKTHIVVHDLVYGLISTGRSWTLPREFTLGFLGELEKLPLHVPSDLRGLAPVHFVLTDIDEDRVQWTATIGDRGYHLNMQYNPGDLDDGVGYILTSDIEMGGDS